MKMVRTVYHQYEKVCDDPFVLNINTEVFAVHLPTTQDPLRYILRQEISDGNTDKPMIYNTELIEMTEDAYAQRAAIQAHDQLKALIRQKPDYTKQMIEQARKKKSSHCVNEDAEARHA